jgi:hypothetical protein
MEFKTASGSRLCANCDEAPIRFQCQHCLPPLRFLCEPCFLAVHKPK